MYKKLLNTPILEQIVVKSALLPAVDNQNKDSASRGDTAFVEPMTR